MDQSICLLGEANQAKLIHFNPLKCETVRLPEGAKFVVAHSLTKKEKALSNGKLFRMIYRTLMGIYKHFLIYPGLRFQSKSGRVQISSIMSSEIQVQQNRSPKYSKIKNSSRVLWRRSTINAEST